MIYYYFKLFKNVIVLVLNFIRFIKKLLLKVINLRVN